MSIAEYCLSSESVCTKLAVIKINKGRREEGEEDGDGRGGEGGINTC